MEKIRLKKGMALLLSTVMGTSIFVGTGAGSAIAMFRSSGNSSVEEQCALRRGTLASLRNQRRQELQNARRQELQNAEVTSSHFSIGAMDLFSSFFTSLTPNADEINKVLSSEANKRGINISSSIIKTVAIKLDNLGFSSITVLNMLGKAEFILNDMKMNPVDFINFNLQNYICYSKAISSSQISINEAREHLRGDSKFSFLDDMLVNTFYKNVNGVFEERSFEDSKQVYENTVAFCNYLMMELSNFNK